MKRILAIGDLHGSDLWKYVILHYEQDQPLDQIIFMGDYVDSFHFDNITILHNLNNLIQYKKENMDKVILLWGNHDIQYLMPDLKYRCSGFRVEAYPALYSIFNEHYDLFELAYQYKNYLFTHGGLSTYIFKELKLTKEDLPNLAECLNMAFKYRDDNIFKVGVRRSGWYRTGGPLWCDKHELEAYPVNNLYQIVGHTAIKNIKIHEKHTSQMDFKLYFIDCLAPTGDGLLIEI